MKREEHILVTGAHRSGSTFVGKVLSLDKSIGYLQEPFNKEIGLREFDTWFQFVTDENHRKYSQVIENLLHGKGKYKRSPFLSNGLNPLNIIGRALFGGRSNYDLFQINIDKNINRLLLKDPIACMSSEWLHENFNMDVVVIIRHPAAFIGSLKRLNWHFDFSDLLSQTELINKYIGQFLPFKTSRELNSLSVIEQGIILWNCIYYVLSIYAERNPKFITVRHEDLSVSPLREFENLYKKLNIAFTPEIKQTIKDWTNAENPTNPTKNKVHVLRRDSKSNIKRWKDILTKEEIIYIKQETNQIACKYYSNEDW